MTSRSVYLIGLMLCSAAAVAQAPTESQPQGVPAPAQGGTTLAPSSRVREPNNDGGMNETAPTNAQEPSATTNPPQRTTAQTPDLRAPASRSFVTAAAQSNLLQLALSKLALAKSQRSDVKDFANAVIRDRMKMEADLKSAAEAAGITAPSRLAAKPARLVRDLARKSGKAFDQAFIDQMTSDQTKTIALFTAESGVSKDPLANFAQGTLPSLREGKRLVDRLAAASGDVKSG